MLKCILLAVCVSVCSGQNPINTEPADVTKLTSENGHVKQTCKCQLYTHTSSEVYYLFLQLYFGLFILYFHILMCLIVTDVHLSKDNNKLGVFIAAAAGTLTLMAVIYCIYNKFYTKNIYAHTQLHESGTHTPVHRHTLSLMNLELRCKLQGK